MSLCIGNGKINCVIEHSWGIAGNNYYDGYLDEMMFFNASLSREQINAIMDQNREEISFSMTRSGDLWSANVTPTDGYESGSIVNSNDLTVFGFGIENVFMNSSLGNNETTEDIAVYFDLVNTSSDPVINWYRNGESFTVLNLPFDVYDNMEKDYSGYGNNATEITAKWNATAGKNNDGAFYFDGGDDIIAVPHSDSLSLNPYTDSYTVAIKARSNYPTGGSFRVIEKWNSFNGYPFSWQGSTAGVSMYVYGGSSCGFGGPTITGIWDGNYRYLVMVVDNALDKVLAYSDGKNVDNWTNTLTCGSNNDREMWIGSNRGNRNYTGFIEDVKIYNISLSAQQILAFNDSYSVIISSEILVNDVWEAKLYPTDSYEEKAEVSIDLPSLNQLVIFLIPCSSSSDATIFNVKFAFV
jgi:hypothetical protein